MELMAVVIIIGIFATAAAPNVILRIRDARVRHVAGRIASIYRGARQRATGRGAAVLVRYAPGSGASGQASFSTREALIGSQDPNESCPQLPNASCVNTAWDTAGSFLALSRFDLSQSPSYEGITTTFSFFSLKGNAAPNVSSRVDVCFTPGGRAYILDRTVNNATWVSVVDIPYIGVRRLQGGSQVGLERTVIVPPSGAARLAF